MAQGGHGGRVHGLAQPRDLPEDLLDGNARIGAPVRREVWQQFDGGAAQRDVALRSVITSAVEVNAFVNDAIRKHESGVT